VGVFGEDKQQKKYYICLKCSN